MGGKRVSSKAEVSAYEERPLERGSGSKVPMQPRSRRSEDRVTVFQVTKRGCSASFSLVLLEDEEEEASVVELEVWLGARLGVEDVLGRGEELVDEFGEARIRVRAGGLGEGSLAARARSASSKAVSSSSSEVIVGEALYFSQRVCTS
jgi:hypothetical protein